MDFQWAAELVEAPCCCVDCDSRLWRPLFNKAAVKQARAHWVTSQLLFSSAIWDFELQRQHLRNKVMIYKFSPEKVEALCKM